MAKRYQHIVVVRGRNGVNYPFPIDMLRYDALHPENERCSHNIEQSILTMGSQGDPVEYKLEKFEHKDWKPTDGRWESRMFEVVEHHVTEQYGMKVIKSWSRPRSVPVSSQA